MTLPPGHPGQVTKRWHILLLWLACLASLLIGLGSPAVQRLQEARVLEVAREAAGGPAIGWLLPKLVGHYRLQKPPLPYWMAGAGFAIAGEPSTLGGRLPTALLGWGTIGITYLVAARLFGVRAGLIAGGALLTNYLFFRFNRLAETDAPATFFVTLSIYLFWRAAGIPRANDEKAIIPVSLQSLLLQHFAAAAAGLAMFSKGPPALFPLLFIAGLSLARRAWQPIIGFLRSGAVLTLLLVGGWWYAYAGHAVGIATFRHELGVLAAGDNHGGWPWVYVPILLELAAPWSILLCGGLAHAVLTGVRRRRDARVIGLLAWVGAIIVPLCCVWNKQPHYLLPLMPPLMILVGWFVDESLLAPAASRGLRVLGTRLLIATLLLFALAGPAAAGFARHVRQSADALDIAIAVGTAAMGIASLLLLRRSARAAIALFIGGAMALLPVLVSFYFSRFEPLDYRAVADALQARFGEGPYCFWNCEASIPLCFNLRQTIPIANTAAQLPSDRPVLLGIIPAGEQWHPPPVGFEQVMRIDRKKETIVAYRKELLPAPGLGASDTLDEGVTIQAAGVSGPGTEP